MHESDVLDCWGTERRTRQTGNLQMFRNKKLE